MSENDLIKRKQLEMVTWFHEFCKRYDITYYIVGGTMLGAIRHNGFIPWDDDIDIGLPRSSFDKLLEISKTVNNKNSLYRIESYEDSEPDFVYPFAKLYDTSTTLIENNRLNLKRGIYIDLFPLDGIGIDKNDAVRNYRKIGFLLNFLGIQVYGVNPDRKMYKKIIVGVVRLITKPFFNLNKFLNKINDICKKKNFEDYEYVGNLVGAWREKEIMPRSTFGKPILYRFENIELYGVEKYDEYLTCLYGDWRKLPPIDKQCTHHSYLKIDLNKSYLDTNSFLKTGV